MSCDKCGYKEKKGVKIFEKELCRVCFAFCPDDREEFLRYLEDKIDWVKLDIFRKHGKMPGSRQKKGMKKRAKEGIIVTRAPLGYSVIEGKLIYNEESSRIPLIFKEFLNQDISLNKLSKKHGLSVNGLKKILKNRTYLGEIKFDGELHKSDHKPLVSTEIFYEVQRKLEKYLRPRKAETNRYKDLRGEVAPLEKEIEDIKRVFEE